MSRPVESGGPIVTALAEEFRARYIRARRHHEFVLTGQPSTWGSHAWAMRHWDGGVDGQGRTRTNVWKRIVTFLGRTGADFEAVLDAGFAEFAGGDPPKPDYFLSQKAVEGAADRLAQAVADVRITFDTCALQARASFARYAATRPARLVWRSVITDPGLDASPLFRFLLAVEVGEADLAEIYRPAAAACYAARASVYRDAVPNAAAHFAGKEGLA